MKTCPKCGTKYQDYAIMCEEDWTPLTDAYLNDPPPNLEIANHIPKSLLIVSYLFLIQSILYFISVALLMAIIFLSMFTQPVQLAFVLALFYGLGAIVTVLLGILFLKISRGLRRGSSGWRTCALVYLWLCLILVIFGTINYFFPIIPRTHSTTTSNWVEGSLVFLISALSIYILTRRKIKDFFIR
jgi:hypothetical protein